MSLWKWWILISGTFLVVGGVAWILKLWVIVATDGRVVATGAAGAFFSIGFFSLLVGSTGLGVRLTINQEPALRVGAAVGALLAFFISFAIFSGVGYAILAVGGAIAGISPPAYLLEEMGILVSAVVWLLIGAMLVIGSVRKPRMAITSPTE